MSVRDCGHHEHKLRQLFIFRQRLFIIRIGLLFIVFILLLTIFVIWAILQPKKPRFILQDATLYAFNTSSNPNLLTSNFQITISSRNPNDKIGIYYDKLDIYATHNDHEITSRITIPPNYQGHHEANVWSPFMYGTQMPEAPYNTLALKDDQLAIRIEGRVRWKVGAFVTGRYDLHVRCPAFIQFGSKIRGMSVSDNVIKYQLGQRCSVSFNV